MAVTDMDEWLRPGASSDEVTLDVADDDAGLMVGASLVVSPTGRRAQLVVRVGDVSGRHDAVEVGPPSANWDRMRIGGVEWRMVEPLRRWDLAAQDPDAGLRVYLAFVGAEPCTSLPDGYGQQGTVSGQVQLADHLVNVTDVPARRSHRWR